ncbi:hatching enzyme, partial [Aphelenchoides avenae]
MHALGIHHEHVRYDRDAYVTINWPTVCHLWKSPFAFEVTSQSDTTNMDEPYDFGSVMHYTQQFDG